MGDIEADAGMEMSMKWRLRLWWHNNIRRHWRNLWLLLNGRPPIVGKVSPEALRWAGMVAKDIANIPIEVRSKK